MKKLIRFIAAGIVLLSRPAFGQYPVMIDHNLLRQEGSLDMNTFWKSARGVSANPFENKNSTGLSTQQLKQQKGKVVLRLSLNPDNTPPLNRNSYKALLLKGRVETKLIENDQVTDRTFPVSLHVRYSPSGKRQIISDQKILGRNVLAARLQADSILVTDSSDLVNVVRKISFTGNQMNDHEVRFGNFMNFELDLDIRDPGTGPGEPRSGTAARPDIRICSEAMQLNIAFPAVVPEEGSTHTELSWNFTDGYGGVNESAINFNRNSGSVILPLSEVNYVMPLVYEKGWFSCRVRYLVERAGGGFLRQSAWSPVATTKIERGLIHEADYMNWQIISELGDDGKRKDIVAYMDGTMRSRQAVAQTRARSGVDVMVTESIYDHEGRPAIQTLAAPVLKIPSFYTDRNLSQAAPAGSFNTELIQKIQEGNDAIRNMSGRGSGSAPGLGSLPSGFQLPESNPGLFTPILAPEPTNQIPCPPGQAPLRYYPLFTVDSSGAAFSHRAFDPPAASRCEVLQAPRMSSQSGASLYYSPENPDKTGHEAYLPQAEGYPYTRQIFSPDKTNRILSSSLPGPIFKNGRGHDLRFFYSTPGQAELDMFLGSNAGLASFYRRIDMVDANGQSRFEIKNEMEKTIISGLTGSKAGGRLDPIQEGFERSIDYEFAGSPADVADQANGKRTLSSKFKIDDDNTQVRIDYQLQHNKLNESLCAESICFDCVYDLSVSLISDECGTSIRDVQKRKVKFRQRPGDGGINLVCEPGTDPDTTFFWDLRLNRGSYTISRILTVNQDVLNGYLALIESRPLCSDILCRYRAMAEEVVDSTACHGVRCGDESSWKRSYSITTKNGKKVYSPRNGNSCLPWPPPELSDAQQAEIDRINEETNALRCKTSIAPCEAEMSIMLQDLRPEGQYAETSPGEGSQDNGFQIQQPGSSGEFNPPAFSVFSSSSILPDGNVNSEPYRKPRKNRFNPAGDWYCNEDGSRSKVYLSEEEKEQIAEPRRNELILNTEKGGYEIDPKELSASLFIKNWQDSWARALLPYHPEFLRLVWCDEYEKPSAQFLERFNKSNYNSLQEFGVKPGTDAASKDEIYNHDPYLSRSVNYAFGSELSKNKLRNYTGNELEQQVLRHHYCNSMPNDAAVSECLAGRKLGQFESMREEEWNTLKTFYLSKRKISQEEAAIKAIVDSRGEFLQLGQTAAGMLKGNDYLKFKRKDMRSGETEVRDRWQGRILRFYDSENAASPCVDRLSPGYTYEPSPSDGCPPANRSASMCNEGCSSQYFLRDWLNRLVTSSSLAGMRPAMLPNNPVLIQETFLQSSGLSQPGPEQIIWKGNVPSSGNLEGRFYRIKINEVPSVTGSGGEIRDTQNGPLYVTISKPTLAGFSWNAVQMFTCISVNSSTSPYTFSLNALMNNGASIQLEGKTNVFNLTDCNLPLCQNLYFQPARTGTLRVPLNPGTPSRPGVGSAAAAQVQFRSREGKETGEWSRARNYGADYLAPGSVQNSIQNSISFSITTGSPPLRNSGEQSSSLYVANIPSSLPQDGGYIFNFGLSVYGEIDWQQYLISQAKDQNNNLMPMPQQFITLIPQNQSDIEQGRRRFEYSVFLSPNGAGSSARFPRQLEFFVRHPELNISNADSRGKPLSWLDLYSASLTKSSCRSCCRQSLENQPPAPRDCQREFNNAVAENELNLRQRNINQLIARFRTAYLGKCMEKTDVLNVRYSRQWYMVTISHYDQAGNLMATVPPKGVSVLSDADVTRLRPAGGNAGQAVFPPHSMVSEYRYNSLNQATQVKTPDAGVSKVWYNLMGQVVMSRSAVQASGQASSYIQYDRLGRAVEEGEVKAAGGLLSLGNTAGLVRDRAAFEAMLNSEAVRNTKSNIAFTQYDRSPAGSTYFSGGAKNLRGRVAARWAKSKYAVPAEHLMHYSYDILGYVSDFVSVNNNIRTSDPRARYKIFHYDYSLLSGLPSKVTYQAEQPDAFYHHFVYDADNRLRESKTSLDGNPDFADMDSRIFYYRNGQAARMEIGSAPVQGTDLAYTIQGWPKFINIPGKDFGGDAEANRHDVFAESMEYFSGDYRPIGDGVPLPAAGSGSNGNLFNGLIAASLQGYRGSEPVRNLYRYDQAGRFTAHARGADGFNGSFSSAVSFDLNGNISTLKRKGSSNQFIDEIGFSYRAGSNRLSFVSDDAVHSGQDRIGDLKNGAHNFDYNENGALVQDDEGKYNWYHFGKIGEFQAAGGGPKVSYSYDASRRRVGKRVQAGSQTDQTWYVLDPDGKLAAVYQYSNAEAPKAVFAPIYSIKQLGVYHYPAEFTGIIRTEDKQYEIHNHLGDVVATVNGSPSTPGDGTSEIRIKNKAEYYPYGLEMPVFDMPADYRFGYNGMEKDRKGEYSTEYRQYDARIGRWKSVDALFIKYPHQSPFAFVSNNPLNFTDVMGLDEDQAPSGRVTAANFPEGALPTATLPAVPDDLASRDRIRGEIGSIISSENLGTAVRRVSMILDDRKKDLGEELGSRLSERLSNEISDRIIHRLRSASSLVTRAADFLGGVIAETGSALLQALKLQITVYLHSLETARSHHEYAGQREGSAAALWGAMTASERVTVNPNSSVAYHQILNGAGRKLDEGPTDNLLGNLGVHRGNEAFMDAFRTGGQATIDGLRMMTQNQQVSFLRNLQTASGARTFSEFRTWYQRNIATGPRTSR
jgi:RHS repeat-associated protein